MFARLPRPSLAAPARRRGAGVLRESQRGIALLIVLWLSVLLTVLASGLAFSTRAEVLAARNTLVHAQARARAEGAVHRALFELARPASVPGRWLANGQVHPWQEGEAAVAVRISDESGRIDLNSAAEPLLRSLLRRLGELDDEQAEAVLGAILDWRDVDDLARPNGAEEPQYQAAGRKYKPANQSFESVEELRRVLGVTDELFARLSVALTVHSRVPGINTTVASRDVLLALPNTTPEIVDAFIAEREAALLEGRPVPPFAPGVPFSAGDVGTWRITAEVAMPENVRFVRETVIRRARDAKQGLTVLLWKEG